MGDVSYKKKAGEILRRLVKENYKTQASFAIDANMDLRTVSRYINEGIGDVDTIQELAEHFGMSFVEFFGQ